MQPIRNRAAATAIAALFAATPLAFGTAAYAHGPVQESGKEVVFSGGGLLGVACGAKPSATSVTVPAESSLRVVNNTGRRAKLVLDGATRGEISSGSAADVLFHRGPVSLALKPDCVLADESSVRVEVVAAPPAAAPAPPGSAPAPRAPGGATSGKQQRRRYDDRRHRRPDHARRGPAGAARQCGDRVGRADDARRRADARGRYGDRDGHDRRQPPGADRADRLRDGGRRQRRAAGLGGAGANGRFDRTSRADRGGLRRRGIRRGNSGYYRSTCNSDSHSVRSASPKAPRGASYPTSSVWSFLPRSHPTNADRAPRGFVFAVPGAIDPGHGRTR